MKPPTPQRGIAPIPPGPLSRWLLAILLLLTAVENHWLLFQWGAVEAQLFIGNLLFVLPTVAAAALGWYTAAVQSPASRRSWAFVALTPTVYSVGSLIWWYLQQSPEKPPFPSLADAFYLAFTPCLVLAFLSFSRPAFRPLEPLRLGLDVAIIVAAAGVYAWRFMFAPTILAYPGQPLAMAIGIAYPVNDLVLLSLLLLTTLRRRDEPLKLEILLLGAGVALMIISDTFFFLQNAAGTFTNSSLTNGGFIWSNVLLALAAYASLSGRTLGAFAGFARLRGLGWLKLGLPYVAVAASYSLMLTVAPSSSTPLESGGVLWGAALVTLLVIVRQIVAFTENSRLTHQLQAFSSELQQANQALTEAKDRAEIANRAKSAFLAAMSHELRTPLNAVLGYAQILLRDKALSEQQARGLSTIQHSGQHLLALINDILDLSKVEAGKLELAPSPIQLSSFLGGIADIIRVRAEKKGLQFRIETAPNLPLAIMADEKRWRQVLLNLLSNAVKFTDSGQVTLRVSQQDQREGAVRLRFTVEDSGVGIAPEQLETIFQPFEQVGEASRRASGTGLGLTISRQLVRMMGGDIQVHSRPGHGSRFWFELTAPVTEAPLPVQEQAPATGYDGRFRTVLVVDDVAVNRALLLDLLGVLGFDLLEAENGEAALRVAEASLPDLILMDMAMPVLDGLAATRRARSRPALQAIPIIIVSASANQCDQAEALAAGANAFVAKPIDQQALMQEVGALLHLTWRYDATPLASEAALTDAPPEPLTPPPADVLAALHQLALAGDLRELRLRAKQLAVQHPDCWPFAEQLAQLADDLKAKAALKLIEAQRGGVTQL